MERDVARFETAGLPVVTASAAALPVSDQFALTAVAADTVSGGVLQFSERGLWATLGGIALLTLVFGPAW